MQQNGSTLDTPHVVTGNTTGLVVVEFHTSKALDDFARRCGGHLPIAPIVNTGKSHQLDFRYQSALGTVPTVRGILPGVDLYGDGGLVSRGEYLYRVPPDHAEFVNGARGGWGVLPSWFVLIIAEKAKAGRP